MKLACLCVCYKEERFIPKYIQHYQDKVDKILVLNSTNPWNGEIDDKDNTAAIARSLGADVVEYAWPTEEEQRNAGLDYLADYDFVLVLDPDEYIDDATWKKFLNWLPHAEAPAYVAEHQLTYWKDGYVADPPRDYQQLFLVKPQEVRFVDKRVISGGFGVAPVFIHHFSWARTDDEVLTKVVHYAHANDFNIKEWYEDVWKRWRPGMIDVHPVTPDTLHQLMVATLPPDIDRLDLWPTV